MKTRYRKYTNLYMFYLNKHHTSILSEVFGYRKSFSMGCWNKLNKLYKKVYKYMERRHESKRVHRN